MGKNFLNRKQFTIADKKVTVYSCAASDCPIIYLNTFADESDNVYQILQDKGCPDFTLVSIGKINWDHDMSPWEIPPISREDTPCTGGADEYLKVLTGEIIPQVEKQVQSISWRGLTGYSLAGLFAIYALYQTDLFARAGSMSGSLWFPGFREYVFSHEMKRKPDYLYFSLGDRECKTGNPFLRSVQQDTEAIEVFYKGNDINTVLQMNPGNHYKNAAARTAAGIAWLLDK